jgi:dTDP-4-amino-4,6-dideoxygalactose transaminase
MKIPFSPPYIDNDIIDEVVDTLKSGWITTGPKVKALEEEVKEQALQLFLFGEKQGRN